MLIDPDCFVIGGGVGLAPGYLDRVPSNSPSCRTRPGPSFARRRSVPMRG